MTAGTATDCAVCVHTAVGVVTNVGSGIDSYVR